MANNKLAASLVLAIAAPIPIPNLFPTTEAMNFILHLNAKSTGAAECAPGSDPIVE